ncbi:hypothetical protein AAMO2058_000948100 [Amorphochlora amoebiformis]
MEGQRRGILPPPDEIHAPLMGLTMQRGHGRPISDGKQGFASSRDTYKIWLKYNRSQPLTSSSLD